MNKEQELSERLLSFAVKVVKLAARIEKITVGRHVAGQLTRSATSAGADYEEACGAESKRDFIHKLQIVLKELREALYWLRLIKRAEFAVAKDCDIIIREADELTKIVGKSIVTARKR